MPDRIFADLSRLEAYAGVVARHQPARWAALQGAAAALHHFFRSGSAFGPAGSDLPPRVAALLDDTAVDALGVLATAAAFAEAEVLVRGSAGAGWAPDDAWIERHRRSWLLANHPEAVEASTPTIDPLEAARRLTQIEALLARSRADGHPSAMAVESLLEERDVLLADGVVAVDALTDAINAWTGSDNDPAFDRLVAARRDIIDLLAAGDAAAARMTSLVNAGVGARPSLGLALREAALEARIDEVITAEQVDRAEALRIIQAMDARIASIIGNGHTAEEAIAAFSIAQAAELDLDLAQQLARNSGLGLLEVLGTMAAGQGLDMSFHEVRAFAGFREHFAVFDNATGGSTDERVSERDLRYVVGNPELFTAAQVLAARAILDEPLLRNRLDTASDNGDILDSDSFGSTEPGDGVVSRTDLDAFMLRTHLNDLLAPYSADIDTAADGGEVDGFFSERDLEAWLDDPANAALPVAVSDGVQLMLDAGLFDQGWWERNRDALAMGAAVVAGGVVIVLTAGTGTPLVVTMGAGFVAGGVAAGGTTLAVNHLTGESLGDGLLANSLNGGMIGLSVAGLPATFQTAATITGGVTLRNGVAVASLASETTGIVGNGGLDLILPDDWEPDIHRAANVTSLVTGIPEIVVDGAEVVIRHWAAADDAVDLTEGLVTAVRAQGDHFGARLDTFEFDNIANPGPLTGHPRNPAGNFYAGRYNVEVLDQPMVVYRAGAADGYPTGSWYTADPIDSAAQARIDLAIRPQWVDPQTGVLAGTSPVDSIYAVEIPAGTTVYRGPVGSQGGAHVGNPELDQLFIEHTHRIGEVVGRIDIGDPIDLLPASTVHAVSERILLEATGGSS